MTPKSIAATVVTLSALTVLSTLPIAGARAESLAGAAVRVSGNQATYMADGVVEAVRQSVIAPQVSGLISQLPVKAGDPVKAGQVIARIDARAARQTAAAGNAQVEAARAELAVAARDYARQKQLFEQNFISQAALDRAEAQFKSANAQANSLLAQAAVADTQAGFYTLTSPYAGWVAEVPAMPGDMAMPGRPVAIVYDPASLRVLVNVPQEIAAALLPGRPVVVEIAGAPAARHTLTATAVTVLPAADAATHTVPVRLDLPGKTGGLTPGMFARALLPVTAADQRRLYLPRAAVFRRAELTAVYVLNESGEPALRQIRTGPALGEEIEVLSGLAAGERVALDPLAAARWSRPAQ